MPEVKFIAAIDDKRGIAKKQKLPWRLPTDQHYFRTKIATGPVAMGYNTYVSNGCQPYGDFENTVFVFSNQDVQADNVIIQHDLKKYIEQLHEDIWVAGGGQIFTALMPNATILYLTRIQGDYECDVFFPEYEDEFKLETTGDWQVENDTKYRFEIWVRR